MDIDCSDARYELKIGDRVTRSLIRHFHAFINKQIRSRGFGAEDPKLFNQDTLEAEAWRLAATVIEEAEHEFRDDEFGLRSGYWCRRRRPSIWNSACPTAWLRLRMTI